MTYRSTPSPAVNGDKSPAELFVGRKLRTVLALLKPITQRTPRHDQSMESQFNKHHGARNRIFNPGDPVLARQYHGNREEWSNGKVLKRVGKVLYRVLVGNKVCVRHANQLRPRYYDDASTQRQDMDTLFEMFDLPRQPAASFQSTSLSPGPVQHAEQAPSPDNNQDYQPRRSTRTRRPTTRLRMDPHQKTYLRM